MCEINHAFVLMSKVWAPIYQLQQSGNGNQQRVLQKEMFTPILAYRAANFFSCYSWR